MLLDDGIIVALSKGNKTNLKADGLKSKVPWCNLDNLRQKIVSHHGRESILIEDAPKGRKLRK